LTRARVRGFRGQGRHEAGGIKARAGAQHVIDGPGQFDGEDGVGLEFVAAVAGLQALGQRADDHGIAFGDHCGFAEGPAEIGIAELGPAQALDLAGGSDGAISCDDCRISEAATL
jgi:hypothetical protein